MPAITSPDPLGSTASAPSRGLVDHTPRLRLVDDRIARFGEVIRITPISLDYRNTSPILGVRDLWFVQLSALMSGRDE